MVRFKPTAILSRRDAGKLAHQNDGRRSRGCPARALATTGGFEWNVTPMALLAESLVEEWLNRDGFFTIRGVKHGVGEMDLLAVRPQPDGRVIGWHVEV